MRKYAWMILPMGVLVVVAASVATAQETAAADLVSRMMAFDKDKNGTLAKSEVTDRRLHRLFDRADADKDGSVTKEELTTLANQEPAFERGGPPGGGPGEFMAGGGPGGFMGGLPRPGEILSAPLQQRLRLTADQKKQVAELQKEVDTALEKILNDDQKAELKAMRERGPGRFGRPGGPGGPGRGGRPGRDRPR